MLPRHARCVLSRLCCNGHSILLSSYLCRIGRIENPFCGACRHLSSHSALSSYGLFVPLALRRPSLFLSLTVQPLVQALGSCPASGAPWSSAMTPTLRRGRVTTTHSAEFRSLSSTNFDFELTLTLIINMGLLSLLTTPIDSNLSE